MSASRQENTCGTCRFGKRIDGGVDCGLWTHDLQSDAVRLVDNIGPYGRPIEARCGIEILSSIPPMESYTPGYYPTTMEQIRVFLRRAVTRVFRQPLDGHRY